VLALAAVGTAPGLRLVCAILHGRLCAVAAAVAMGAAITMRAAIAAARADKEALVKVAQAVLRRLGAVAVMRRCGAIAFVRRAVTINDGLRLVLWILWLVLAEFLGHLIDEALVMLRMLQVAFGQDAVARGGGVAREGDILLVDLECGAADAHIGAVAVERLHARVDAPAAVLAAVVMMSATATATAAHAPCILIVSHADFFTSLLMTN
jgi:hypothetical protein